MTRHESNEVFALTSFLDGANASYLSELYALYEADPASVPPDWHSFFASLGDDAANVIADAEGPSWRRRPSLSDGDAARSIRATVSDVLSQQQALDAERIARAC